MTDTDLIRRALKLASKIETKPEYKHPLQIACEDEAIGAEIIVLGSGDYPSMRNLADGARADLDAAASAIRGLVGALHFPPYPGLANRFMAGEIVTEKAGAGDGVEAPALRPETTSEHIARDIREGRFPEQSPVQMVPVEAPAHAEPVAWYWTRGNDLELTLLRDGEYGKRLKAGGFTEVPLYAHPAQEPPSPGVTAGATRPERLWLWPECHDDGMDKAVSFPDQLYPSGSTEYIRADLASPAPVVPAEGLDPERLVMAWMAEQEGFATRGERFMETIVDGNDVAPWLHAACQVGIDAALRSAPPVGARVSIPSGLIDALRSQRQIDADGCEVAVSRQACDEAAAILAALLPAGEGE